VDKDAFTGIGKWDERWRATAQVLNELFVNARGLFIIAKTKKTTTGRKERFLKK